MRHPQDPTSAIRWLPVVNTGSAPIPPYAVMRVSGIDSTTGYYQVGQPNADSMTEILINGPSAIPGSAEGQGHRSDPCTVLYETIDGTPAVGEDWGTESGSWKLRKDKTGFRVLGVPSDNPNTVEMTFLGVSYREIISGGFVVPLTVFVATTGNVDLAGGDLANGQTIDGQTLTTGDLVLVRSQTTPNENGVYQVPSSGAASRYPGFATGTDIAGRFVSVNSGTLLGDSVWLCTRGYYDGAISSGDILWVRIDATRVSKNGTPVASRRYLNFIEGSGITLTVADDSGDTEVDVTIAASVLPADPNANKLLGWDDTDGAAKWWALGTGLSYDHATYTVNIDSDLQTIVGLPGTGVACRTGSNTWALRTLTAGDGISIAQGDGVAGNPTISASTAQSGWVKVSTPYSSFSAASTTNDIEVYSLPAGGWIQAAVFKHSTAFAGTGIATLTLDLGITGSLTRYAFSYNGMAAVSGTTFYGPTGSGGTGTITNVPDIRTFSAATSVRVKATSAGANLDQLTAGVIDVYLLVSTLP